AEVLSGTKLKTIVAGGIKSYDDIKRLKDMGAEAVIVGKAIYLGKIELKQAEEIARSCYYLSMWRRQAHPARRFSFCGR
ncbi:MAG: hypothetical protein J6T26_00565, partial [Firmicutes bacterium]|nr:hypothetical protein [Bacillota bacterium]